MYLYLYDLLSHVCFFLQCKRFFFSFTNDDFEYAMSFSFWLLVWSLWFSVLLHWLVPWLKDTFYLEVRSNNTCSYTETKHPGVCTNLLFWFCCSAQINLRRSSNVPAPVYSRILFFIFWKYYFFYFKSDQILSFFMTHVKMD